jgi:hypothetical protein
VDAAEIMALRNRMTELAAMPERTIENSTEVFEIKFKPIKETGWCRGKALSNNQYSYLER